MFSELFLNALRTIFYEPSLWLMSLKLRKAYIHSTVFDVSAKGVYSRCVNNNTSVKNHSMCSAFRLVSMLIQNLLFFFILNKNIYFKQKYASLAFGNIVALTVDSVNIRATCASALPTRSQSLRGPLMSYKNN